MLLVFMWARRLFIIIPRSPDPVLDTCNISSLDSCLPLNPHLLLAGAVVLNVGQVQMSLSALGCKDHHPDDTTRAAVPLDRL
jgi:hypothetical protein